MLADNHIKLVIVGDDGVGKTTLIETVLHHNILHQSVHTDYDNYVGDIKVNKKQVIKDQWSLVRKK